MELSSLYSLDAKNVYFFKGGRCFSMGEHNSNFLHIYILMSLELRFFFFFCGKKQASKYLIFSWKWGPSYLASKLVPHPPRVPLRSPSLLNQIHWFLLPILRTLLTLLLCFLPALSGAVLPAPSLVSHKLHRGPCCNLANPTLRYSLQPWQNPKAFHL